MGFLEAGSTPLTWSEVQSVKEFIREHGVIQLLNLYQKFKDYTTSSLYWGEEMEYHIVYQESSEAFPKLYVKAAEKAIPILTEAEELIEG